MKFDQLPNEILIECFEYLNTFDIFYSFDQLTSRCNKLIRNISLNINLPEKNEKSFRKFFYQLSINSQLRNHIISLKISNIYNQLNSFFSFFSLIDFCQLHLLTLIDLNYMKYEEKHSILLSLSNFYNDYPNDLKDETCKILSNLFLSKIQMKFFIIPKIIFITSLTMGKCYLNDLCQLFQCLPMLNYLHIEILKYFWYRQYELNHISSYAFYLKQLLIDYSKVDLKIFEFLLKQTPNLELLTIGESDEIDMIDDKRWQNLIQSSLHHLNKFQFQFIVSTEQISLNKFQNDFWSKVHHWDVIGVVNSTHAMFFTILYRNNEYELYSNTKISGITLNNKLKVFQSVTDLSINILNENFYDYYYFENVNSLTISGYLEEFHINQKQKENFFQSLPIIVNLSNLKHLNITRIDGIISSIDLLKILKKARKLSSLEISKSNLISFLINDELCQYLNEMIKILIINKYSHDKFIKFDQLNRFCQVFSNIEQLQCSIDRTSIFLYMINHMKKLRNFQVNSSNYVNKDMVMWLKTRALNLNINCTFV